jgi:hypothetical protein
MSELIRWHVLAIPVVVAILVVLKLGLALSSTTWSMASVSAQFIRQFVLQFG